MSNKINNRFFNLEEKQNLHSIRLKKNNITNRKLIEKDKNVTRKIFIDAKYSIETDPLVNIYNNDITSQQNTTHHCLKNYKKPKKYFSPSPYSNNQNINSFNEENNNLNYKSSKTKPNILKPKNCVSNIRLNKIKKNINPKISLFSKNSNPSVNTEENIINRKITKRKNSLKKPEKIIITAKDIEISPSGKKYATDTRTGIEEDGKTKENNQDSSIIISNVCNIENYCIIGVMDGHGTNGHLVSNFVKNKINEYFNNKKLYINHKTHKKMNSDNSNNNFMEENEIYEKMIHNNYEIIRKFYQKVNDELYDSIFDVHFSGCTCVIIFIIGKKLICSNVGDSRAILIKNKLENNKTYQYTLLSNDHKPNIPEEKERIEKMGGEVEQTYEEEGNNTTPKPSGIFRVWKKGCEYPGLAISRSLGDKVAELIGVISDPEILEFQIDDSCKYVVSGSDGIWDYLSNQDVIDIVNTYLVKKNPEGACYNLVERATKAWKENEDRVDDITVCVYFF